jgi:hypothetical protein
MQIASSHERFLCDRAWKANTNSQTSTKNAAKTALSTGSSLSGGGNRDRFIGRNFQGIGSDTRALAFRVSDVTVRAERCDVCAARVDPADLHLVGICGVSPAVATSSDTPGLQPIA